MSVESVRNHVRDLAQRSAQFVQNTTIGSAVWGGVSATGGVLINTTAGRPLTDTTYFTSAALYNVAMQVFKPVTDYARTLLISQVPDKFHHNISAKAAAEFAFNAAVVAANAKAVVLAAEALGLESMTVGEVVTKGVALPVALTLLTVGDWNEGEKTQVDDKEDDQLASVAG